MKDYVNDEAKLNELREKIKSIEEKMNYMDFDTFIIRELGFDINKGVISVDERRKAFMKFREKTNREMIATLPTMRRWFGINDFRKPSRKHIYMMCVSMGETIEKTQEYLMDGIGETSFIYSDIIEIIYIYLLENHLSNEDGKRILRKVQDKWKYTDYVKVPNTRMLKEEFNIIKNRDEDKFVDWIISKRESLVGYDEDLISKIKNIKKRVYDIMRENAQKSLEIALMGTGFEEWLKEKKKRESEYKHTTNYDYMKKFVTSKFKGEFRVSENAKYNILELALTAYSMREINSSILNEIYPKKDIIWKGRILKMVSMKRFSDLFNMENQRKKYMNLWQKKTELFQRAADAADNEKIENLDYLIKEQYRRCIRIKREDILPMLHYIAQYEYSKKVDKANGEYDKKSAKSYFIRKANKLLMECNMKKIDADKIEDRLMLESFGEDEMYSLLEMTDVIKSRISRR